MSGDPRWAHVPEGETGEARGGLSHQPQSHSAWTQVCGSGGHSPLAAPMVSPGGPGPPTPVRQVPLAHTRGAPAHRGLVTFLRGHSKDVAGSRLESRVSQSRGPRTRPGGPLPGAEPPRQGVEPDATHLLERPAEMNGELLPETRRLRGGRRRTGLRNSNNQGELPVGTPGDTGRH